ncbi:sigma 54-interacting transcriptional regulator [Nannocystis pusilla]|uniref:sigma 54-interacting transcriptional regulator n=1 Tax=Nannocystis pusilla TaxID=889268 RepID=UPI003DA38B94
MVSRQRPDDDVTLERSRTAEVAAERGSPGAARLVLVHPPELRRVVDLGPAALTLGRQPQAPSGLAVAHPTLSRVHAELRFDRGIHWLRDLQSRNGTCLQGQAINELPRALAHGAVIRIGNVLLVYEMAQDPRGRVDPPEVDRAAIPGDSLAIAALRSAVLRIAGQRSPALVIGETGTGKERIAAEIHRLSKRRGELIVANCAALSPTLIESQLFGHDRGAFTGASQRSSGLFRAAEGGTLVLDEIGELPLELQPKLLRAIEYGEIIPVGSSRAQSVDVRIVGATNRDLGREVEAGRFRRDLYARLALAELRVPPLRERRADLLDWLDRLFGSVSGTFAAALSTSAAEAILLHAWPENLRGLHRLVMDCRSLTAPIRPGQLPAWLTTPTPADAPPPPPAEAVAPSPSAAKETRAYRPRPPREELLRVLEEHEWSIRATAKHYERDRKQISRWIEFYTIALPGRE